MKFRVTDESSQYFGKVGTSVPMDLAKVAAERDNLAGLRSAGWWSYWPILLDFGSQPYGVGFKPEEVEAVRCEVCGA